MLGNAQSSVKIQGPKVQKERRDYFNILTAAFQAFCWFAGSDPEQGLCCRPHAGLFLLPAWAAVIAASFKCNFPWMQAVLESLLGQATATSYGIAIPASSSEVLQKPV